MVQQPHIDEYHKKKQKKKKKQKQNKKQKTKQKHGFACKSSLQKPYFEKKNF